MSQPPIQRPAAPAPVSVPWSQLTGYQQKRIEADLRRMLERPDLFTWCYHGGGDKWQAIPVAAPGAEGPR